MFKRLHQKLSSLEKKYKDISIIALDYMTSQELERQEIIHICLSEVTEQFLDDETWNNTYQFMREMESTIAGIDSIMKYRGLKLWNLNVAEVWRFYLVPIIKTIDEAFRVLKKEKIEQVVIFNNSSMHQKVFALVAKSMGLKVIGKINENKDRGVKLFTGRHADKILKGLKNRTPKPTESKDPKTLFFYDHCETDKVLPWARELQNCDRVCVGLDPRKEVSDEFKKAGIRYERFQDYADKEIIRKIEGLQKKLEGILDKLEKNENFKTKFEYKGVRLWPVCSKLFSFLFYERFIETLIRIEVFNKILDTEKPEIVCGVDDWSRYPNTLLAIAKQKNLKTFVMRYGLLDQRPKGVPVNADRMAVYGQSSVETLVRSGVSRTRLFAVGQPEGKENKELSMEKVNNVLTALGLDRTRPIIVFGGTCVPESASYHPYDIFYNTIKKYRNLQVVSKPHPAESERLYKTLLKKHGVSNNILTKKHLLELLAGCTALVTTKSTVALEAMAYGKPVIYINTMNAPLSSFPKRKEGMVEIVKTGQELSEALDRILRTGKTEEAKELAKQYVKQKGKPAAVEVAKIIENML